MRRRVANWCCGCLALTVLASAVGAAEPAPAASASVDAAPAAVAVDAATAVTGDARSDRLLADIDRYAARHRDAFLDELVRYFDAPRALVEDLIDQPGWSAGDLYYACAVARAAGRPCRAVAGLRARQRDLPWQAIAGQVGIVPGSTQAERIRDGFADSYGRWARPLPPDTAAAPPADTPASKRPR